MKILIINQILYTNERNGDFKKIRSIKDTMIYGLCLGFKNNGHTVVLAAASDYKPINEECYDFEVLFFKSILKKIFNPSFFPFSYSLWKYIKGHHVDYDLIISSETFMIASLFSSLICPQKTIIWQELTGHQNKMHKIPSKVWYNVIARIFMRKVFAVVPRSRKAYSFIKDYMPSTTSLVIDHGINVEKFKFSDVKKRQLISSSQLIQRKNVDGIIKAFSEFHKIGGYEDIMLMIAGRGDQELRLKQLVSELKIDNFVQFVGFLPQEDLNKIIRESMCFLVNTKSDLNMVSIPEAICSGTPILTNMQPASADYIADNNLGIAKENWGPIDIVNIIENNQSYINNCKEYRNFLTNDYTSELFVKLYNKEIA